MNQNNTKGKLRTLIKSATIMTTMLFAACSSSDKPEEKVLQSIEGTIEKESGLIIRHIDAEGRVLLGTSKMTKEDCSQAWFRFKKPIYQLEGKASINDPAIIVYHYEDQVLESGRVRRVVTKWGVRSKFNKEIEDHFQIPKE